MTRAPSILRQIYTPTRMVITINMGTLSRARAVLASSLVAGLVLYTLSSGLGARPAPSPPPPPPLAPAPIPHGISVFDFDPYQKHLVVPRLASEDVFWLTYFPPEMQITLKPYLVDAGKEEEEEAGVLTTPVNKGHEAMAYLTYIIDHYHTLPDIAIFTHAHASTWHNNDLQLASTPVMLLELNYRRVARLGFMNLRCHWAPGCPAWIHTNSSTPSIKKEVYFAGAFRALFPGERVPAVLAGACCAQFAVTRATIQRHPKQRYVRWREWLVRTELPDEVSGRVWEYLWQYVFPGPAREGSVRAMAEACPLPSVCYCDGYGYCFGGARQYEAHAEQRARAEDLRVRLRIAEEDKSAVDDEWRREGMARVRAEIKALDERGEAEAARAKIRGKNETLRREELGSEFSGGGVMERREEI